MKDQVTVRALKIADARHKWSQVEFAKKLGISKQRLNNWLNRSGMPGREHARVAKLLGISVEELLGEPVRESVGDLVAAARISEPSVMAYNVKLTEDAVLFAAEFAKLPRALQAQVSALVHAMVGELVRDGRPKPKAPPGRGQQPNA